MSFLRAAIWIGVIAALGPGTVAAAHETGGHGAGAEVPATAADPGAATHIAVTIDPESADPQVIPVARGAQIHLSVHGTGANPLHLHGYDLAAQGSPGQPALFVFDAVHTGRFAVKMHTTESLLGSREKAVLYIEVRNP